MTRDYEQEIQNRIAFIREALSAAQAEGIVYGNSGGKDSALVGILCKLACANTVGLIMPCGSQRNYREDMNDALTVARRYEIETRVVDLTPVREALINALAETTTLPERALINIAPRLRMTALYAVATSENRLVAGTGNRSEGYLGYFTKWGDGAYDFNPIADLTVTEIYAFLRYLQAPECVISKTPSAGLFDGQTDEGELGVTYRVLDEYLLTGVVNERDQAIIERYHAASKHKRTPPLEYGKGGRP
ncbi:MAG: NAD(+) synthase [Firmicutes bacterium]|nr:NAD(+) synthase [Bacillota bacterium]